MAVDLLARVRAEIDGRLAELRPFVAEYERLLGAAGALVDEAEPSPVTAPRATKARPRSAPRPRQARMGASEQAIVAALEHGSHTVSELGVVTAMSGPQIRDGLRRLLKAGKIARTRREGRVAYELAGNA
jgi:DNA-binding transcriptional ArsR family regulator